MIIDSGSTDRWEAGGLIFFTLPVLPDIKMKVSLCDPENIYTDVTSDETHNPE